MKKVVLNFLRIDLIRKQDVIANWSTIVFPVNKPI